MRKIIFILAVLAATVSSAQEVQPKKEGRFQLGIHYQIALEKYPIRENGIGVAARVRAVSLGPVSLHAGLSATYRAAKLGQQSDIVILNPALFAELDVFDFGLKPYIGIGYDYYKLKTDETNFLASGDFDPYIDGEIAEDIDFHGYNINPGVRFHFSKILYADASYNYLTGHYNSNRYPGSTSKGSALQLGFGFRF